MSHFAVYALTRNVGIDIVPLPPLRPGTAVPAFPARYFPPPPPPRRSRISDFAKFLQAGRCYRATELREPRWNAKRVYFGNGIYSVQFGERTSSERSRVSFYHRQRFS